jgi:peptidoglycan/LPS O-acetylase OafA/YrhL
LVFFVHYVAVLRPLLVGSPIETELAYSFSRVGHIGVDIFFILSGYLIYGSVLPGKVTIGEFARRRARRIYPTFLVVFAVYVALSALFPTENKIPAGLTSASLYLGANALLLPGVFPIVPLITVAWSLSYEIFFYLTAPLAVTVLRMRTWSPGPRVALITVGSAAFVALCWMTGLSHLRMILFAAGALVWEAATELKRRNTTLSATLCIAGLPLLVGALASADLMSDGSAFVERFERAAEFMRTVLLAVMLSSATLIALQGRGMLAALLRVEPMRWMGNVSYSYYLIHGLALKFVGMVIFKFVLGPSVPVFFALMPFAFAGTVVASIGLFAAVERRFSVEKAPAAVQRVVA